MEAPSSALVGKEFVKPGFEGNGSGRMVAQPTSSPAQAEQSLEPLQLPPKHGLSSATLATLAVAAGLSAIALGAWAVASNVSSDESKDAAPSPIALEGVEQVVSLLSKPSTERIPLQGSRGRIILVVGARSYGVLVLDGLAPAPAGKSYQAWVIGPNAQAPLSAAVFSGGDVVVPLTTPVPPGAVVAITLERAGGVTAPTRTPKLVAKRAT